MIGGQKIIAVCAAKVHEDDVQSYLYPLHLALDKNGYKDLVLATTTDLYENNLFDKGEAGIFRLIDSNMIDAVVLFANTLKMILHRRYHKMCSQKVMSRYCCR